MNVKPTSANPANYIRPLFDVCFAIAIFLPGFMIGWGVLNPLHYTAILIGVAAVYLTVTKFLPRIFTPIVTIPIMALQLANIGSFATFRLPFEYGTLKIMLNADSEEIIDFVVLAGSLIWLVAPVLIIAFGLCLWWYIKSPWQFRGRKGRLAGVLAIAVSLAGLLSVHKTRHDLYSYIHIYRLAFQYDAWHKKLDEINARRTVIFKKRLAMARPPDSEKLDDIVVIFIGESARRREFSLYGYKRKTSPNLERRRNDLLIFTKAISPANSTLLSNSRTLTPLTVGGSETLINQLSLVSEAKLAGFYTSWLTNTNIVGRSDSTITIMAKEADEMLLTRPEGKNEKFALTDDALLPMLDKAIAKAKAAGKRTFIFLGTRGSHTLYGKRFPEKFAKYQPAIDNQTTYSFDKRDQILNAYDNSILFTDWMIDQVIKRLEKTGRPATLFYFSDHGEMVMEDGKTIGHGYNPPKQIQFEIPLIMWKSKNSRCKAEKLNDWADKPINSQNLFYITQYATCIKPDLPDQLYSPKVMALKPTNIYNYENLPEY
jgi:glucan phosphoethanolaminetransferase (alkaline phosphatase superfamily)